MRDRRRLHNKTFSRAVSLLLGLLLCLEPLSVVALAVMGGDAPAAKTTYKPIVVVEGNAVVTGVEEGADPTADDLTGFFEVALKVQTAAYYDKDTGQRVSYEAYVDDQKDIADAFAADGTILTPNIIKVDDIDFGTVAATLKYDADIFTPVSWSATEDIFDANGDVLSNAAGLTDINALTTDGFASLDAIGPEEMLQSDAVITKSTDNTNSANEYVLTLSAWARRENVRYDQPTTVVVVRFAYNKNLRPMLTTDDDSGEYVLGAADFTGITMTGGWNEGGTAVSTKPERPVLWLATKDEAVESHHGQSVWYDGNYYESGTLTTRETAYYYYIEAEGSNPTNGSDNVPYIDKNGVAQTAPNVAIPNTEGAKVLSLDYGTTGATPNYLDNVLKQYDTYPSLVFDFVNAASFLTSGVNVDDVAPILFYDWDDTLLGVLVVEKGKDVRAEVNEFVSQWVHPDIIKENYAVSSLTRAANYRGKYDFNGPTTDPGNADTKPYTEGAEEYPLTNKLDYVFFKRPMEFVDTDIDTDTEADTWQQKDADSDSKGDWDPDYPYVYGWASCVDEKLNPDPAMVEATWTTLGMGELSGYNGASLGGYEPIGTDPATFTYDSEEVTFTFADFEAGVDGPTYVKAVYEPGENLLTTYYSYRMVDEPYYNKLNGSAAQAGAAYSVDVTFERSSSLQGNSTYADGVYGVARIREPVVRQNTTTDVKWEEEDLINSTIDEAYSSRAKITYAKIDVENTEQISFTLALSGRHNRIDYYLADNYGNNFVSGGARIDSNNNIRLSDANAFVIDNYNYMNDESVTDDEYYDASYENRDGSHGFVLYGTLNKLMEEATKRVVDPTYTGINSYVNATVLADANIRLEDGSAPATAFEVEGVIELLVAAAQAAMDAHIANNDDYWNAEKNCAQLTYHQLQGFIINNSLNHNEDPVTDLKWCHLHAECAAEFASKPTDWAGLIEAVKKGDAGDLLSFVELNTMAGLRSDANGARYNDSTALLADLDGAVDRLTALGAATITWDMVQGYILDKTIASPAAAVQLSYEKAWWYNGGVEPVDFATSLAAAIAAANTGDPRPAAIDTLKDAFDAMYAAKDDPSDTDAWDDWNALTGNLTTGGGVPFDSFEDFKTAIQAASALGPTATWGDVQFYIIHGHTPGTPEELAEIAGYWWYNGGQQVVDIETLVAAAQRRLDGETASWDAFTLSDLYDETKDLHFRMNFAGEQYTDASFADFKAAVLAYVADPGASANVWDALQYYLIHGSCAANTIVRNREAAYYWWKGNGAAGAVDLTLTGSDYETKADRLAALLSEAVFLDVYNGNTAALSELTTDILAEGRLVAAYTGTEADFNALSKITDMDAFKTALRALIQEVCGDPAVAPVPTLPPATVTWQDIQEALLTNADAAEADEYWWKVRDDKPSVANTPQEDFATLQTKVGAVAQALRDGTDPTTAVNDLRAWFTVDVADNLWLWSAWTYAPPPDQSELDGIVWDSFDYASAGCWDGGTFALTWYQVVDIILNQYGYAIMDPASAQAGVEGWGVPVPDWVAASASVMSLRPETPEEQYTSETTVSEDGLTTTVVETLGTWNDELGDYDWTVTTTVTRQVGEATVTTITVTTMTYDPETWQPIFNTTAETLVTNPETGDATYGLEEDTDLTPVQPSDEADDQTPEDSAADAEDEAQTSNGGDQTYQTGADTQTTPVETAGDTAAAGESETAGESEAAESDSETGAVSAASAGLLSLAWRTDGTGPGISLTPAGPVSTLRVTGILDTGQLFGSQRDGPLGIIPSRSNLPTAAALLAHRRI